MILIVELASVALCLLLIVTAAAITPAVARRFRQSEEWIEENNWRP